MGASEAKFLMHPWFFVFLWGPNQSPRCGFAQQGSTQTLQPRGTLRSRASSGKIWNHHFQPSLILEHLRRPIAGFNFVFASSFRPGRFYPLLISGVSIPLPCADRAVVACMEGSIVSICSCPKPCSSFLKWYPTWITSVTLGCRLFSEVRSYQQPLS